MKQRLTDLALRRMALLKNINAQRREVAEISRHWKIPLALLDAGLTAVRFMRDHPAYLAGGVVALLPLRHHGVISLVQKGWRLLCIYPSIIAFAMKYIAMANRSGNAERDVTEVDH